MSVLKYQPKVRFVVADCGFTCLYDLIGTLYRSRHVGFLLDPVNLIMEKKYHFNMKQTCPRDALKENQVPLCLIHGTSDTLISPKNSDELAAATAGYKEVHKVEGAEHACSRYVLGEESSPDHNKLFTFEVLINGEVSGRGSGRTKKEAEQMAACKALESFRV